MDEFVDGRIRGDEARRTRLGAIEDGADVFVHGERDELIPLARVRAFYARLQEPKDLLEIDRATHLFEGQAGEVGDVIRDLLVDFSCAKP